MATIQSERDEFVTRIANRVEELQTRFDDLMQATTRENDMETLARIERAKKSIAEKGEKLDTVLEQARRASREADGDVGEEEWETTRETLEAAWREYREALERAELEFERAEEFS